MQNFDTLMDITQDDTTAQDPLRVEEPAVNPSCLPAVNLSYLPNVNPTRSDSGEPSHHERHYYDWDDCKPIFKDGLRNFLSQKYDCKILAKKQGSLKEEDRRKICHHVVDYLLQYHSFRGTIHQRTFIKTSEEIVKDFPDELVQTWYVPYRPKRGDLPKVSASGKLEYRYCNIKRNLKKEETEVEHT